MPLFFSSLKNQTRLFLWNIIINGCIQRVLWLFIKNKCTKQPFFDFKIFDYQLFSPIMFLKTFFSWGCKNMQIFSSPEHNMLRMSYCDRSLSGIHPSLRPSVSPFVREQLLKKSSLKPANRFQCNFTEMILW